MPRLRRRDIDGETRRDKDAETRRQRERDAETVKQPGKMIEITCNDRLGKKIRVKCNPDVSFNVRSLSHWSIFSLLLTRPLIGPLRQV